MRVSKQGQPAAIDRQPSGRPRDTEATERILAVAADVIASSGYAGFSLEVVADQTGVAKTTIYRRWPSKDHLVVEVVTKLLHDIPLRDTGEVRRDLVTLVTGGAASLAYLQDTGNLVSELVAVAGRNSELRVALQKVWAGRRQVAIELLEKAVERGQLLEGCDLRLLVDELIGPLWYRLLVTGEPSDADYTSRLVDDVLASHVPAASK
jgi:AcrR family transcriptional regulator